MGATWTTKQALGTATKQKARTRRASIGLKSWRQSIFAALEWGPAG